MLGKPEPWRWALRQLSQRCRCRLFHRAHVHQRLLEIQPSPRVFLRTSACHSCGRQWQDLTHRSPAQEPQSWRG
jgi:hypothetical protein